MLKPHGVICVKENISKEGFLVDRQDSRCSPWVRVKV